MTKHKVFISYHHKNDQEYKRELLEINKYYDIFTDKSVDTGDIDENLDDETIRQIIRDEYLRDSTVTIVLVGTETKYRKHIDWEIYSSMFNGKINKKSGILVIELPHVTSGLATVSMGEEYKSIIFPDVLSWESAPVNKSEREEYYCNRYPYAPRRIIDNLVSGAPINIVPWSRIYGYPDRLRLLIEVTHNNRLNASYNLERKMRRRNGP